MAEAPSVFCCKRRDRGATLRCAHLMAACHESGKRSIRPSRRKLTRPPSGAIVASKSVAKPACEGSASRVSLQSAYLSYPLQKTAATVASMSYALLSAEPAVSSR